MTPYDDQDSSEAATADVQADWKLIREDLDKLRADLARLGEKSLAEGQDKLAEELAQLRAKAASLAAKATDTGRSAHDDVVAYVRNNPITSVGGAFGLGLLVAALLTRRS
jgi:ElaB/YqjD/DUF883 family membrane-anchored ribosome-binding protein